MAAPLKAIAAASVLLLAMAQPARAQDTVLLIDGSGSMVPYYGSGLVHTLADHIVNAAATVDKPDLALFHTSVVPLPGGLDELRRTKPGGNTLLTDALNAQKDKYELIWIVTDNVQDTGGRSETRNDMANFYAALQDARIQFIYVFPLTQNPGTPGLLVYAIGTMPDATAINKQADRFVELTKASKDLQLTQILMKPLGENAIDVRPITLTAPLSFQTGDELEFSHKVIIGPRYEHLYFESSPATGTTITSPFRNNSCLVPEKGESSITPQFVQTEREGEYTLAIDFGRVTLKPTFACWLQAAFGQASESEEIQTPIEIQVSGQSLRLSKDFLEKYSAESPEDAKASGKIYGIRSVPGFVAPDVIHVPVRIPRQVLIKYPQAPAVIFLSAAVLMVAGGFLGGRALVRKLRARSATPAQPVEAGRSAAKPPPIAPPPVKGVLRKR